MTINKRHMKVLASTILSNQMYSLQPDLCMVRGLLEVHGIKNWQSNIGDINGITLEFNLMKKSRAKKLMSLNQKWMKDRSVRAKRLLKKSQTEKKS